MQFVRTNRVIVRAETKLRWVGHRWLAGVAGLEESREKVQDGETTWIDNKWRWFKRRW